MGCGRLQSLPEDRVQQSYGVDDSQSAATWRPARESELRVFQIATVTHVRCRRGVAVGVAAFFRTLNIIFDILDLLYIQLKDDGQSRFHNFMHRA